ncbi:cupredoxin domain-containing protein [Candidatus Woesearchaeota archaeon]|nr:cupredoxin domain-containing protein [Candidatus Woesearchaeota archaeon]
MKKIIMVLVLATFIISACSKEDDDTAKARKIIEYHKKKFDSLPLSGKVINGVREIEVKGSQYEWQPENIVVKKGEKVRLLVASLDVPHGFEIEGIVIPGWDIGKLIKKGDTAVLEFTAEEAGSWDTVCTGYCGPGHGTMKRKFIVRE